eukprot:30221-Prymnesium_polylepis.1
MAATAVATEAPDTHARSHAAARSRCQTPHLRTPSSLHSTTPAHPHPSSALGEAEREQELDSLRSCPAILPGCWGTHRGCRRATSRVRRGISGLLCCPGTRSAGLRPI